MDDENPIAAINEAVADISEEHSEIVAENVILESALDAANQRAEDAIQAAEVIAASAMETERGNRIAALEREISEWQGKDVSLQNQLAELKAQMSELAGQISALATLELTQQSLTGLSSLIPPQSETMEATEILETIVPEAVAQSVAESPALQVPDLKRAKRWI